MTAPSCWGVWPDSRALSHSEISMRQSHGWQGDVWLCRSDFAGFHVAGDLHVRNEQDLNALTQKIMQGSAAAEAMRRRALRNPNNYSNGPQI